MGETDKPGRELREASPEERGQRALYTRDVTSLSALETCDQLTRREQSRTGPPPPFTERAPSDRYTDGTVKRAFTPSGHKRVGSTLDRDTTGIQCRTGQGLHSSTNQATERTQLPIGA